MHANNEISYETKPLPPRPNLLATHAGSDASTSSGSSNTITLGHSYTPSPSTTDSPVSPPQNLTEKTVPSSTTPSAPPKKKRLFKRQRPSTAPTPEGGPRPPLLPARSAAVVPTTSTYASGRPYEDRPILGYSITRGKSPGREKSDRDSPPRSATIGIRGDHLETTNAEFAKAVENTVIDGVVAVHGESCYLPARSRWMI